jgi:hypothetical protein
MPWRALFLALLLCFGGASAMAREVAGVQVAETANVDGRALKLVGAGLRTKLFFKVYVAALYAETPQRNAQAMITSDQVKLTLLRSLDATTLRDSITEGFERNSKAQMGTLQPRLNRLNSWIPSVKEGDRVTLTWLPGTGTRVTINNVDKGTIDGKDFVQALFAIWLGPVPAQEELKQALLGG